MRALFIILGLSVSCMATTVRAATLNYELLASGNSGSIFVPADLVNTGDTLSVTVRAEEGYAFYNDSSAAGVPDRTRGTYSFQEYWESPRWGIGSVSFYNDDQLVYSGGAGLIGIPNGVHVFPKFEGYFDTFIWTLTFTGSTEQTNTIRSVGFDTEAQYVTAPVSAVPLPAAAWMFASALLGMLGVSRGRKSARPSTLVAA